MASTRRTRSTWRPSTPVLSVVNTLTSMAAVPIFILAWGSVVIRYRRSDGTGRAQIRWLAATTAVALLAYGISFFAPPAIDCRAGGHRPPQPECHSARDRDRGRPLSPVRDRPAHQPGHLVRNRDGCPARTYVAIVLVLQGPLGAWFGTQTVTVAISTLVVAGLFQPVRSRIQRAVDRRFDRARVRHRADGGGLLGPVAR